MKYLQDVVEQVEERIQHLQKVREVLVSLDGYVKSKPWKRTRTKTKTKTSTSAKRVLSADARKRIAAAQHKRWAKYHRTHKKAA